MENLVEIKYAQSGQSSATNEMGMREMQAMVYAQRHRRHLLVKAPPASGKSRAMMFVALDKLAHQGVKKVIVAVPEKTIGRSFNDTKLSQFGFFADWKVAPYYNLCSSRDSDGLKREQVKRFFSRPDAKILICTHSTLRNAMREIPNEWLNDAFFGIDEFHHTSADVNNNLGELIRRLLNETTAHILAMTGSYFRGDAVPVMRPEDEAKFQPTINYTYYQQLSGYKYLKSLGIGYKFFFTDKYIDAFPEALDTTKKTLIHIPNVNSKTAYENKLEEVNNIIKCIGKIVKTDYEHYLYHVQTPDGRILKVGDLVEDNPRRREALQAYLQRMKSSDELDILIALDTAKEGFDWVWCECCITIGVRSSLTEIVQIIGRCTRDCEGKSHAQFINMIPCPDAAQEDVSMAVNDFLKAISASLLMEQVMAPRWTFRTKREEKKEDEKKKERKAHEIEVEGLPKLTERAQAIVDNDLDTLIASTLSDKKIREAIIGTNTAEIITELYIPKIIREKYTDLTDEEVDQVAKHAILTIATQGQEIVTDDSGNKLIRLANRFVNLNDLSVNLIGSINPFQRAYEILSKSLTTEVLRTIQYEIESQREEMTREEAILLFSKYLPRWREEHNGNVPTLNEGDANGRRIAMAIEYLRKLKQQKLANRL